MSEMPAVSCDRHLGKFLEDVELDLEKITEHMLVMGFTPKQIESVQIHVSANTPASARGGDTTVLGSAQKTDLRANIFPKAILASIETVKQHIAGMEISGLNLKDATDGLLSAHFSKVLVHELQHLLIEFEELQSLYSGENASLDDLFDRLLGAKAVSFASHGEYWESEEEQRCRAAQENAPPDLVKLTYKAAS
jgi:hypothetical protein